jgi:hypothetical protein
MDISHGLCAFPQVRTYQSIRQLFYFVRFGPKNVSNLLEAKLRPLKSDVRSLLYALCSMPFS